MDDIEDLPPDALYVIQVLTWAELCAQYHEQAKEIDLRDGAPAFVKMTELQTKVSIALDGLLAAVQEAKTYMTARRN